MPVLCALSALNVNRADASLDAPGEIVATAYLASIVGTKELRPTTLINDCLQHSCYALARHARIRLKCKTFACEGVHHAEHAQTSPACRHIAREINRPFLIRLCQDAW